MTDIGYSPPPVTAWPGLRITGDMSEVEGLGIAPDPDDPGHLLHPPEWEYLGSTLPDSFSGSDSVIVTDDYTAALAGATLIGEALVHEVMEWLHVDGRRVFTPHPVNQDGLGDTHWDPIADRLKVFFKWLMSEYGEEGFR